MSNAINAPTNENRLTGGSGFSRLAVVSLVASNLLPLGGVLLAGWETFPILLLFCLENIVIGFYNVLRMCKSPCDLAKLRQTSTGIDNKHGLIVFFCVHYGAFVLGHLLFVVIIFGVVFSGPDVGSGQTVMVETAWGSFHPGFLELVKEDWAGIGLALLGLFASHGISYWKNFLEGEEYKRITANDLMMRPYGRMVVMHVTIILGGFAVGATGSHVAALTVLVVLKIGLDLIAHLKERKKFRKAQPGGDKPAGEETN